MSLKTYAKKRDFKKTPEPAGSASKKSGALSFVVQRHDASHLHYDFRLEMEGVLKSWAIPKGPSLNPGDKRLAVMVEDHPLKYGGFSGEIPAGNYGAGTVEIWDKGTYEPEAETKNAEKELLKELAAGSLKFKLHGEQLNGSFALVALKNSDKNWLLIKHKDEFAEADFAIEDHPSLTALKKKENAKPKFASVPRSVRGLRDKVGKFIHPMLASLGDKPFDDKDWIFEIKWDGYRAIAEVTKNEGVALYSRNGISFVKLYPGVVKALGALTINAVLDGEVVALDEDGKPDFQGLQNQGQSATTLVYYVFDCLSIDGKDLTGLPLLERKERLKKILPASNAVIRYSDHVAGDGEAFFGKVVERGLEGMIAKNGSSRYTPGKRSQDWLKIKNQNTQEAVIAGFTEPRNSRNYFGALVLGRYDKKKLIFIGHTGTGFSEQTLKSLYETLTPLIQKDSPFAEKIPMHGKVTWVKPEKVATIKFSEVTKDGILRHPVFIGLRIDKGAKEVTSVDKPVPEEMKKAALRKAMEKKPSEAKPSKSKTAVSVKPARKTVKKSPESKAVMKSESKPGGSLSLTIDKKEVVISHPDKVFWPDEKITKRDVVEYYRTMAKFILPHLKDRPQSLKRTPNGITDKGFFHKDAAGHAPDFVEHQALFSESAKKKIDYIICNNEATLAYLNNLGCIEINPWNSRLASLDNPDYLILDLDPSEGNSFDQVIETANVIHALLQKAGAPTYPKTSGASGMHIYIPLHAAYEYDQIRTFAQGLAEMVVAELPGFTTTERSLAKRGKKIYVDFLQNRRGQTLSCVYSLRPVVGATVSTPLDWKEVKPGLTPAQFTIYNSAKRATAKGDIFAPVLKDKIDLEKCLKKLGF